MMQRTLEVALQSQIKILSSKKLNNGDLIDVWRVEINQNGNRESLIVKSRPDNLHADHPYYQSFVQESLCYQLLSALPSSFGRFPKLLKALPNTLVLQDLGPDIYDYPTDEAVMAAMADTFAQLHFSTSNQYERYCAIKAKQKIGDISKRQYSKQQCGCFFQSGIELIQTIAKDLNLPYQYFIEQMQDVQKTIDNPGDFLALIHGDILNRRQSVSINGEFFLLDFEQARYSHALIDIATTLVGKFDLRRSTQRYFLNHPGFSLEYAQYYRQKMHILSGDFYSEKQWQKSLGSALIYVTLLNVGALMVIPSKYHGHQSVNSYFKGLIGRLLYLLEGNGQFSHSEILLYQVMTQAEN